MNPRIFEAVNLGKSITSLLYNHDCVIIPDFGGVVANEIPAKIHPRLKVISPPSKQLTFNKSLVHNDGLLVNRLTREYGWAYALAMSNLQEEVRKMNAQLDDGGRIEWEGVGIIYRLTGGEIQFLPDNKSNFLLDSIGFESVLLPEVRKESEKETQKEHSETKVIAISSREMPSEENELQKDKPRRRRWVAAAIILPLVVVGGALLLQNTPKGKQLNLARFNPFEARQIETDYQSRIPEEAIVFEYDPVSNSLEDLATANPDVNNIHFSFSADAMAPDGIKVSMKKTPLAVHENEVSTEEAAISKLELYFIVGGAFADKSNADRMVEKLRKKGYDASIFGKKRNLHMVCFGAFSSRESAKSALQQIKATENKGAWIKRHRS